jgi:hypothetical protein
MGAAAPRLRHFIPILMAAYSDVRNGRGLPLYNGNVQYSHTDMGHSVYGVLVPLDRVRALGTNIFPDISAILLRHRQTHALSLTVLRPSLLLLLQYALRALFHRTPHGRMLHDILAIRLRKGRLFLLWLYLCALF